jgi:hypothetical protein
VLIILLALVVDRVIGRSPKRDATAIAERIWKQFCARGLDADEAADRADSFAEGFVSHLHSGEKGKQNPSAVIPFCATPVARAGRMIGT